MSAALSDMSLLSPEMALLLARAATEDGPQPDPTTLSPAEGRAQSENANRRWNLDLPPMESAHEMWIEPDATLGSFRIRIRLFVPHGAKSGTLLFVHGGGFAFCSPETHERCARVLARETGMAVLVPDYRLAPEHPYPAGLMDVITCLRKLQSSPDIFGVEAGPIVIAGDSAGANLALAAILHEQQAGRPPLAGALLFYGTFARDFTTPSYREFAEGPGLTLGKMQRYWQWYVGDRDVGHDPLACPLTASDAALAALPPLHLTAAAIDPLLSDTLSLHQRLQSLGRSETVTVTPGVTHGFLQNTIDLAAAREALSVAAQKAKEMTARM